jgi:hypothetical protein
MLLNHVGYGIAIYLPCLSLCLLWKLLIQIQKFVILISSQNCLNDVLLASWAIFEILKALEEFVISRLAKNSLGWCMHSFVFILC